MLADESHPRNGVAGSEPTVFVKPIVGLTNTNRFSIPGIPIRMSLIPSQSYMSRICSSPTIFTPPASSTTRSSVHSGG